MWILDTGKSDTFAKAYGATHDSKYVPWSPQCNWTTTDETVA